MPGRRQKIAAFARMAILIIIIILGFFIGVWRSPVFVFTFFNSAKSVVGSDGAYRRVLLPKKRERERETRKSTLNSL